MSHSFMFSESSLTISCVKVEMSSVVFSDCLLTRRPNLGCRVRLKVITRFEVLLMSLVTARKSTFVIGLDEPGETLGMKENFKKVHFLKFHLFVKTFAKLQRHQNFFFPNFSLWERIASF